MIRLTIEIDGEEFAVLTARHVNDIPTWPGRADYNIEVVRRDGGPFEQGVARGVRHDLDPLVLADELLMAVEMERARLALMASRESEYAAGIGEPIQDPHVAESDRNPNPETPARAGKMEVRPAEEE